MNANNFEYVGFQALNRNDTGSRHRPGYRFDLPNLPGVKLIISRRDDANPPYWQPWGIFDETSGLYIGIADMSRNKCYELAVKEMGHYTPEQYAMVVNILHCDRTTAILTGAMK